MEQSDEHIAQEVQRGNTEAFGVLVERYDAKMARYARKFLFGYDDAQDRVQDVFIKAYTNIQSFDPRRSFSPWLYRIAHNEFVNAIKKRGREKLSYFDSDTLFPHPTYEAPEEDSAERQEVQRMLDACLDKLDPKYREPLVLYYYEELDYQKISEILQIPVSTAGIRLRRGKAALKTIVEKEHPHFTYEH